MTVFTDHKRTVNLELQNWDGDDWSPDWSRDFWNVGELKNLNDDSDVFPEDGPYAALLEKHDLSASEPVYEVEDIDAFMTLAFVSLPVIPKLRLNTYGIVDVDAQQIVPAVF